VSLRNPSRVLVISLVIVASAAVGLAASQSRPVNPLPTLVPVTALQALLPSPPGWTRKSDKANQVSLSPTCDYTFATAVFEKDQMRIKMTLADSGRAPESLMALAAMVVSLPEDYSESVSPTSTIKRLRVADAPAAELWDGAKGEGEITVIVDGRFVATLEGFQVDSLETLRSILQQLDLKKVAALK